jgi:hypothetical protein
MQGSEDSGTSRQGRARRVGRVRVGESAPAGPGIVRQNLKQNLGWNSSWVLSKRLHLDVPSCLLESVYL